MANKEVIENLERQVRRLIDEHKRASKSRDDLAAECMALKKENRELQERIKTLESELSLMELSEGLAAGDKRNKDKARARVNRLMREVDRCIAIVSKQGLTE